MERQRDRNIDGERQRFNIHFHWSHRRKKENESEAIFEKITSENFLELRKDIKSLVEDTK